MEVQGKFGIRAKVLKKSRSAVTGIVFTTYEIEYPRIILAELNTHRMLPKNSASSRAIPYKKMLEQLHGRPVRFGQANPGMQDKGEDFAADVEIPPHLCSAFDEYLFQWHPYVTVNDFVVPGTGGKVRAAAEVAWEFSRFLMVNMSGAFFDAGFHKQVYNRLTEASQMMKTVISGTEWANFFWLRNHEAADPTLQELARVMHEASFAALTETLEAGEWHLPYIDTYRDNFGVLHYGDADEDGCGWTEYELVDAIKISCARCAAVSFRNVDYTLEKSREVYDRLVGDERKHASAFEHCATPMKKTTLMDWDGYTFSGKNINFSAIPETWEQGITHMDRQYNLWSGPLKGFIQYRKLIPGENFVGEY